MPEPTIHKRLTPAPKQVKFPSRRHNTRSGAARSPPPKLKRQSTLTQLDFVSTPDNSREVVLGSSDEDEEYTEPKPKRKPKRRKRLDQRARDQSSLTQNWRRAVNDQDYGNSDGGLADWEEDAVIMDTPHEANAQDTQGIGKYLYGRVQEVSSETQHLPSDGQSVQSSAERQHRMLVAPSDAGDESTRPTTADSNANPKTPKTSRRTEVPSSQTPSSAVLSVHTSRTNRGYDVSPLKGRSCTPTPLKKARHSQTSSPSKRMLKHMVSDIHNMDALTAGDIEPKAWKAEVVSSPRQKPMTAPERPFSPQQKPMFAPPRRGMIRASTIQDSQDDLDYEESPELEPDPTVEKASADLKELPEPTRRSLKRTSTVLDSQTDSDSDEIIIEDDEDMTELPVEPVVPGSEEAEAPIVALDSRIDTSQPYEKPLYDHDTDDEMNLNAQEEDDDDDSHGYDYTASLQQQTFDPVSAALDRDAARFGRGRTQLDTQHRSYVDFGRSSAEVEMKSYEDGEEEGTSADVAMEDDDDRVEDSEPEFVADSPVEVALETQYVADSPPVEVQWQPSPELGSRTQAPTNASNGEVEKAMKDFVLDNGSPSAAMAVPEVEENLGMPMPPSPELPRPSQVSTVVSTQRTSSRPHSREGTTPTSPQKSGAWANGLSSSPFPLPPESWRAAQSYRNLETQSSDIFDFSLPPPPPLLSSARQTPASSSR